MKEKIVLKPFTHNDVPYKVKWINNPEINQFLHYKLPLNEKDTYRWLEKIYGDNERCDLSIYLDDKPVGIIGLLHITENDAEIYITIGEKNCQGKGIAFESLKKLCIMAFEKYKLHELYLFTETGNERAVHLYQKFGMKLVGTVKGDVQNREGKLVDRYKFSIALKDYEEKHGYYSRNTDI